MNTALTQIIPMAIVAAAIAVTVKKTNPEAAMAVSMAAGVLILLMLMEYLAETVEFMRTLASEFSYAYDAVNVVLKITGIAYLCEFAVQLLKDAGQGAIGGKVELAGKVVMIAATLPLVGTFFETVMGILR